MATGDKYNLNEALDKLEDDVKLRMKEALVRAENTITLTTILSHWKEILICLLLLTGWILYQRMDSAQRELATKNETFDQSKKIDAIDETLKQVEENQKTVYPQINATVQQIEATRAQLRALDKKIQVVTPAKFQEDAKKLSIDELSKELQNLGYTNTIIRGDK